MQDKRETARKLQGLVLIVPGKTSKAYSPGCRPEKNRPMYFGAIFWRELNVPAMQLQAGGFQEKNFQE